MCYGNPQKHSENLSVADSIYVTVEVNDGKRFTEKVSKYRIQVLYNALYDLSDPHPGQTAWDNEVGCGKHYDWAYDLMKQATDKATLEALEALRKKIKKEYSPEPIVEKTGGMDIGPEIYGKA